MEVFSKSYLKAVVEVQGELFDNFARQHPDCDTDDFITAYMNGKTRADIDAGQAYVCTMNADELMRWYLRESGYRPKPGESMKGFMPDWIGRFYATCQWQEKKGSREVIREIPLDFLKIGYAGLHDLDLELAVAKVCGHAPADAASVRVHPADAASRPGGAVGLCAGSADVIQ